MTNTVNLSDTSTWLPLEGLAPGFDASKAALSSDLDGRTFTLADDRGTRIVHTFAPGEVAWDYQPGTGDRIAAAWHFLVDLELLDLDTVHAVTRPDDQLDALAFSHFDTRRFELESLRHDLDGSWLVLSRRGPALSERIAAGSGGSRVEGRRSRGGVLLVRHRCRPQQERRPRRGN